MSIGNSTVVTSGSNTNGATTTFPFSFSVAAYGAESVAEQLEVVRVTTATGAETALSYPSDFSVSVNGDQSAAPGGSITTTETYASGYRIYIRLRPVFEQQTELQNQGAYNADVVEAQFDHMQRQLSVLQDRVRRAPRLGIQAAAGFSGETTGAPVAGYGFYVNNSLDGFYLGAPSSVAVSSAMASVVQASTIFEAREELAFAGEYYVNLTPNSTAAAAANVTALNAVIAAAVLTGGIVYIGLGRFYFNAPIVWDETADGSESTAPYTRVRIVGQGDGPTTLAFIAGSNGIVYSGASAFSEAFTGIEKLRIESYDGWGNVGVLVDNASAFSTYQVSVHGFEYGMDATDLVLAKFDHTRFRANKRGWRFRYSDSSYPNAIAFRDCQTAGNLQYGGLVQGAAEFLYSGGSIEGNGRTGSTPFSGGYGIKAVDCGVEGVIGVSLDSVYMEGNADTADVWLVQDNNVSLHAIRGCSFLRYSSSFYTTNNIKFTRSGTGATTQVAVSQCAFKALDTYSENDARRYIDGPSGSILDRGDNFYDSTTAKPNASATRGPWAGRVLDDGTAVALPKDWTSVKDSTGVYTITHNLGLGAGAYAVSAIAHENTGRIVRAVIPSTNSFVVVTSDLSPSEVDVKFGFQVSLI